MNFPDAEQKGAPGQSARGRPETIDVDVSVEPVFQHETESPVELEFTSSGA